jgi:hypothetical protein
VSPTTGAIRHPDVSEISDLTEGLLSPSRTAEIRRHLGDCGLCADVRDSLDEIRALLGTLPGPPRMPADIAGRIDAALAAEALLDATTSRTAPALADADAPRTEGAVSRETAPAQPAQPAGPGPSRPAGHPSGATGPGRRRARRRIALVTGVAAAAACALGVLLFNGLGNTPDRPTVSSGDIPARAARPSANGAYTPQNLGESVRRLLDPGQGARTAQGEKNHTYGVENGLENTPPAAGTAPGDRSATGIPPCVLRSTGRSETPLATERGTYEGAAVYLLVLPHPADPGRVVAYVVGTGCEGDPAATPGGPLLTESYPRS